MMAHDREGYLWPRDNILDELIDSGDADKVRILLSPPITQEKLALITRNNYSSLRLAATYRRIDIVEIILETALTIPDLFGKMIRAVNWDILRSALDDPNSRFAKVLFAKLQRIPGLFHEMLLADDCFVIRCAADNNLTEVVNILFSAAQSTEGTLQTMLLARNCGALANAIRNGRTAVIQIILNFLQRLPLLQLIHLFRYENWALLRRIYDLKQYPVQAVIEQVNLLFESIRVRHHRLSYIFFCKSTQNITGLTSIGNTKENTEQLPLVAIAMQYQSIRVININSIDDINTLLAWLEDITTNISPTTQQACNYLLQIACNPEQSITSEMQLTLAKFTLAELQELIAYLLSEPAFSEHIENLKRLSSKLEQKVHHETTQTQASDPTSQQQGLRNLDGEQKQNGPPNEQTSGQASTFESTGVLSSSSVTAALITNESSRSSKSASGEQPHIKALATSLTRAIRRNEGEAQQEQKEHEHHFRYN